MLYVKALRALNLSLLFAQGEIRVGHLKPSNAVKNGRTFSLRQLVITIVLAPVVQRLDNAIHRINHYPVDKC